jgi:hypothetical protein
MRSMVFAPCPVRSAARSEAKPSEVVRCRHGTAKGSELVAVPDQQCTTSRRCATLRAALHPGHSALLNGAGVSESRGS